MKKYLIILSAVLILIMGCMTQNYSTVDIDADNYEEKLKENDMPIYDAGIDAVMFGNYENFALQTAYKLFTSENYNSNGLSIAREVGDTGKSRVDISSLRSGFSYNIWFDKNDNMYRAHIYHPFSFDSRLTKIAESLIIHHGFILKPTNLKTGHDILIKETEDSFIIVEFNSFYEDPRPPMGIIIKTYSKKKI